MGCGETGGEREKEGQGNENGGSEHASYTPWTQLPIVMDCGALKLQEIITTVTATTLPSIHTPVLEKKKTV